MEIAVLATLAGKEECADGSPRNPNPRARVRATAHRAPPARGWSPLHFRRALVRTAASPDGLVTRPPGRPTNLRWLSAARAGSQESRRGKAHEMPDNACPVRFDRP